MAGDHPELHRSAPELFEDHGREVCSKDDTHRFRPRIQSHPVEGDFDLLAWQNARPMFNGFF